MTEIDGDLPAYDPMLYTSLGTGKNALSKDIIDALNNLKSLFEDLNLRKKAAAEDKAFQIKMENALNTYAQLFNDSAKNHVNDSAKNHGTAVFFLWEFNNALHDAYQLLVQKDPNDPDAPLALQPVKVNFEAGTSWATELLENLYTENTIQSTLIPQIEKCIANKV